MSSARLRLCLRACAPVRLGRRRSLTRAPPLATVGRGENGYIRVAFGKLLLEEQCAWGTINDYTAPEKNNLVHCWEGGENCS